MRFRVLPLLISLSSVMLVHVGSVQAGVFPTDVEKAYADGSKAAFLAGSHTKKGVDCATCHPSAKISDSETEVNGQCVQCHGDAAAMGKASAAVKPNPHDSHLGNISCTACHAGHAESTVYCSNCHDFPSLKVPYGKAVDPALAWEDLDQYKDVIPTRVESTDLLIVGSGAAASVAALQAHELGVKKIVMLEKQAIPGGNSQLAAGGMNAAGSRFQKAVGIDDNPELMYKDTMKGGKEANNPDLVKLLAYNSAESIDWLAERGAKLESVGRGGGASAPRMHGPAGGEFVGPYLQNFFKKALREANVDLRLNSKMVRIVRDGQGAVTGVVVKSKHNGLYLLKAKAVVLATGGIGRNKALLKELRPDIPESTFTSNQPGSQGDGLILARNIGAADVDVKEIQLNPTLLVGSPVIVSERVRGAGAVFVNVEGKRFISELTTRDKTSAAVSAQTDGVAFEIFDQKVRDAVKQTAAAFELGLAKEGATLEELAVNAGIDPKALVATIGKYNEYAKAGKDPDFDRPGIKDLVDTPPFYAIKITPAIHHHMGGVKIDAEARVIDTAGKPIDRLFAAGEVTGGVHGKNRLGGNAVSDTITFGRIAGQSAAKAVLGK